MPIRDTRVKVFTSEDHGYPPIGPDYELDPDGYEQVRNLLLAVLTDGYGGFVPTSVTVSGATATLVCDGGHHLVNPGMAGHVDVGVVIALSGATGSYVALNREWRATVVDARTLAWDCGTGIPGGTATGALAARRAPIGLPTVGGDTARFLLPAGTGGLGEDVVLGYIPYNGVRTNMGIEWQNQGIHDTNNSYDYVMLEWDNTFYFGAYDGTRWRIISNGRTLYIYCGGTLHTLGEYIRYRDDIPALVTDKQISYLNVTYDNSGIRPGSEDNDHEGTKQLFTPNSMSSVFRKCFLCIGGNNLLGEYPGMLEGMLRHGQFLYEDLSVIPPGYMMFSRRGGGLDYSSFYQHLAIDILGTTW